MKKMLFLLLSLCLLNTIYSLDVVERINTWYNERQIKEIIKKGDIVADFSGHYAQAAGYEDWIFEEYTVVFFNSRRIVAIKTPFGRIFCRYYTGFEDRPARPLPSGYFYLVKQEYEKLQKSSQKARKVLTFKRFHTMPKIIEANWLAKKEYKHFNFRDHQKNFVDETYLDDYYFA